MKIDAYRIFTISMMKLLMRPIYVIQKSWSGCAGCWTGIWKI